MTNGTDLVFDLCAARKIALRLRDGTSVRGVVAAVETRTNALQNFVSNGRAVVTRLDTAIRLVTDENGSITIHGSDITAYTVLP